MLSKEKAGAVASIPGMSACSSIVEVGSLICIFLMWLFKPVSSAMPHDSLLVFGSVSLNSVSFVSGTIGVLIGRFLALSVMKTCFFELPFGSRGEKA